MEFGSGSDLPGRGAQPADQAEREASRHLQRAAQPEHKKTDIHHWHPGHDEKWNQAMRATLHEPLKLNHSGTYTVRADDSLYSIAERVLHMRGQKATRHAIKEESNCLVELNKHHHPSLEYNQDFLLKGDGQLNHHSWHLRLGSLKPDAARESADGPTSGVPIGRSPREGNLGDGGPIDGTPPVRTPRYEGPGAGQPGYDTSDFGPPGAQPADAGRQIAGIIGGLIGGLSAGGLFGMRRPYGGWPGNYYGRDSYGNQNYDYGTGPGSYNPGDGIGWNGNSWNGNSWNGNGWNGNGWNGNGWNGGGDGGYAYNNTLPDYSSYRARNYHHYGSGNYANYGNYSNRAVAETTSGSYSNRAVAETTSGGYSNHAVGASTSGNYQPNSPSRRMPGSRHR